MKKLLTASIFAVLMAATTSSTAFAQAECCFEGGGSRGTAVPEFDPASSGALAVLLAGGAYLIWERRRRHV